MKITLPLSYFFSHLKTHYNLFPFSIPAIGFKLLFCHIQLDDEDSILPSKLQSALENVLERRRELANERGGDTPSGET